MHYAFVVFVIVSLVCFYLISGMSNTEFAGSVSSNKNIWMQGGHTRRLDKSS